MDSRVDVVEHATPWPLADVLALAPDGRAAGAARRLAVPGQWAGLGCDGEGVWGLYRGSGAEPYQTVVVLSEPAFRCSCPSRQNPCKHALALLLLWSAGHIASATRPVFAAEWLASRVARAAASPLREADPDASASPAEPPRSRRPRTTAAGGLGGGDVPTPSPGDKRAAERADRVARGLRELDRWLADCVRTGLTAPALAQYATWDTVAARMVDAQAPALAHRLKRLSGAVGTRPGWHEHVLGELGALHLLCEAGRRLPTLDPDLADSVRTALGWTVRQADVLARPPETDRWVVAGRSDTLEDRIVVRRLWLRGLESGRWALLLSFAAYGQALADNVGIGRVLRADLHRYPGAGEVRCVLGAVHAESADDLPSQQSVRTTSLAGACDEVGWALAAVPWIERWPVSVAAAPTLAAGRWVLADHTGSLPVVVGADGMAPLVAISRGGSVDLTCEWTSSGLVPLAAHLHDRSVDLGPRGGFHERPSRAWGQGRSR